MRRCIIWAVLGLLVSCSPNVEVSDEDCAAFARAFGSVAEIAPDDRVAALSRLADRFPDEPGLRRFADALAGAEELLGTADSRPDVFVAGLDLALQLGEIADEPPVSADVAAEVAEACPRLASSSRERMSGGADHAVSEPGELVALETEGAVDRFVSGLARAHRSTAGSGCDVLRDGLDLADEVLTVPHLTVDAFSAEVGCVFVAPAGDVLLAIVALDGEVAERLRPLVEAPGRVRLLTDVFQLADARGVAAFDPGSDGWLVAVTPGTPDPRGAIARVEASLG